MVVALLSVPENPIPHWYVSPEWWLVILGFPTLFFIGYQAKKSAEAATAAKDSAAALVNSERAWLSVEIKTPNPPYSPHIIWIDTPITNYGKTPARVKQILVTKKFVPFPENSLGRPGELPEIPEYENSHTVKLEGRDIIIAPGGTLEHMHIEISPQDLARMHDRSVSLYVYGFVEYLDTIKEAEHKTCFCAIYWVAEENWNEPTGFIFSPIIPPAYFCAT